MPQDSGNHEGETQQDRGPKHGAPLRKNPSGVPQRPQSHGEMEHIPHEEGRHERKYYLLLKRRGVFKVFADRCQDEDVYDAKERADVGKLEDRDEGWTRQDVEGYRAWFPGCLCIVCLDEGRISPQQALKIVVGNGMRTVSGSLCAWTQFSKGCWIEGRGRRTRALPKTQ